MKFVVRRKNNENDYSYYYGPSSWEGAKCTAWDKLEKAKRFDSAEEARKEVEDIMYSWSGYETVEVNE